MSTFEQITEFCHQVSESRSKSFITVDTEFLNCGRYRPVLCLIQIAYEEKCILVDPFIHGHNLSSITNLLTDPQITKVFHDARQDIPLLNQFFQCHVSPVADTYIISLVLNYPNKSFSKLVYDCLNVALDKSEQQSQWSRRPLTQDQVYYAMNDVLYLVPLYDYLTNTDEYQHWVEVIKRQTDQMVINVTKPTNYNDLINKFRFPNLTVKNMVFSSQLLLSRFQYAVQLREQLCCYYDISPSRFITNNNLVQAVCSPIRLDFVFDFRLQCLLQV